ncbi:hypothetical protein SKAU_G00132670 [Synaphobranchus kaupii]|uniref:Uncharacterized protein n=1 Tax=Synaphobranchus kaupii TaxID=118154 RepID=A0A9Q1FQQ1_SYNKA|nr:hypothetical protein SKAU_G00132670 [Synaphobranchus kaupii]
MNTGCQPSTAVAMSTTALSVVWIVLGTQPLFSLVTDGRTSARTHGQSERAQPPLCCIKPRRCLGAFDLGSVSLRRKDWH